MDVDAELEGVKLFRVGDEGSVGVVGIDGRVRELEESPDPERVCVARGVCTEVLPALMRLEEAGLSKRVDRPTEERDEGSCDGRFAEVTTGTEEEYGKECWEAIMMKARSEVERRVQEEEEVCELVKSRRLCVYKPNS